LTRKSGCNPLGRRVCRDVDPDNVSAVDPNDDEGIEQVETDSWNNEQVHGGNVRRVVTQEGSPSLAGWPPSFDHVLGDARLRDLKPEIEQFAVNAWRTQSWFSVLICLISARNSISIRGRPPREFDFERQKRRKPARCQCTSVSGRTIVTTSRINGNHRYIWTRNQRSLFVR
jgi:hypothetical protein